MNLRDHRPPWNVGPDSPSIVRGADNRHPPRPPLRQVPSSEKSADSRPADRSGDGKPKKPPTRLRRRESLQEGYQRLSLEHLDYATLVLAEGDGSPDRTVHEVRKALRRVRGLLRLVRDELGPDIYRFENVQMRDAGRLLSEARSAAVALETLELIEDRYAWMLVAGAFTDVRSALEARRAAIVARSIGDPELPRQIALALRSARARQAALPLAGTLGQPSSEPSIRNSYQAIAPGLARTYRRGRRRMADAYRSPSAEAFHHWRKRVRYLRFQLETLTGMWPEVIGGAASAVDTLGETLGSHHDLVELKRLVQSDRSLTSGTRQCELLTGLIDQHREHLQHQARTQGRRVYAEPTGRFVKRLGVYWEAWRG